MNGVEIVGDGGSAVTVLQGGGLQASGLASDYSTTLRGITLRDGQFGIHAFLWHEYSVYVTLADVQILDMTEDGILADAYGGADGFGSPTCVVALERSVIARCGGDGAIVSASSGGGEVEAELVAQDCTFADCAGLGVRVGVGTGYIGDGTLRLSRCQVTGNGAGGARAYGSDLAGTYSELTDSLVAGNAGDGLVLNNVSVVTRCTIADNLGRGIARGFKTILSSSILFGNADQIDGTGSLIASYNCVDDPDVTGGVGNFAADPDFRNAAAGDRRLRFGSPCLDAADPAFLLDGIDLDGRTRNVDGDLDTQRRVDVGAYELATLELRGAPRIGTSPLLLLWGPPAGSARVFFTPAPPLDPPQATAYGLLELDRSRITLHGTAATASGPPGWIPVPIPLDPSLVGQTWSFQSLSSGPGGGPPMALSSVVSTVILP